MGPKERGRPLSTPAAARLPRHAASCGPPSPVPSRGGTVAIPGPDDSSLAADEGVPKVLSRKTLVEFPQKVPSALRERGSDAEALRKGRGAAGGSSPSSSSSSSSSSSESESDDEGGSSEVGSPGTRRGGGRAPTPEASRPLENRAPQMSVSAKAKARSPRPHPDLTSAEQPRGAEKPGTPLQPARGRKSAKPDPAAAPQGEEEFVKQSAKGEKQKMVRANRAGGDSWGSFEVRTGSSDQTRSGVAAQAGGGPAPTLRADQTATREWPRAAPGARARPLQRGPGPAGDAASAPLRTADAGPQVPGGGAEAPGETPEGRPPVASAKPAPVQDEGVFREEAAAPRLAAQSEATEDAAAAAEPAGAPGAPGACHPRLEPETPEPPGVSRPRALLTAADPCGFQTGSLASSPSPWDGGQCPLGTRGAGCEGPFTGGRGGAVASLALRRASRRPVPRESPPVPARRQLEAGVTRRPRGQHGRRDPCPPCARRHRGAASSSAGCLRRADSAAATF